MQNVLVPVTHDLHEARPPKFEYAHPTVSLIVVDPKGRVLLAQFSADSSGKTWGFPQRKLTGADRTGMRAVTKCLELELGLTHADLKTPHGSIKQLGEHCNEIAEERNFSSRSKQLIFTAVYLGGSAVPKALEGLMKVEFVESAEAFVKRTTELRKRNPLKWRAMAFAINCLHAESRTRFSVPLETQ